MHGKFDGLGRFADPSVLILTSLADGPKHGYAIMTDVAAFSGVRMEPGTLYGALARLERRGWVRPLDTAERRRPYEITAAGQEILAEQVTTMQQIVQVARLRAGMAWGGLCGPGQSAGRPGCWSAATHGAGGSAMARRCSTSWTSTRPARGPWSTWRPAC